MSIHAAILGATGYGGGELLRLLLPHPECAQIQAISHSQAGKRMDEAQPQLRGLTTQRLQDTVDWRALASAEHPVLFAALPHGEFARRFRALRDEWTAAELAQRLTVIDLSGDFRLRLPAHFELAYGQPHPCPEFLADFVYGLSEWQQVNPESRYIANPGCFATALALAMAPLAKLPAEQRPAQIAISAVTGSSGSGATPGEGTHHATRAHDFRAYKPLTHQHVQEVAQGLRGFGWEAAFSLVTHSAPMVRGIYATAQFQLGNAQAANALKQLYTEAYPDGGFVRVCAGPPRLLAVLGSNFVDLQCVVQGRDVAVLVALDNLVKGMAGQAVQNMNLALGLNFDSGLRQAPLWPA